MTKLKGEKWEAGDALSGGLVAGFGLGGPF